MALLEDTRQRHAEIRQLSSELVATKSGEDILRLLTELSAILSVHLALEEEALYPLLKPQTVERARVLARRFIDATSGLRLTLAAFAQKWVRADEIIEHRVRFEGDLKVVLEALEHRLAREEAELFSLL